ncbi:MAG TPA: hypothetical protein VGR53_09285 [Nitrososphaerales archaeon]|nr:hypothetical protein [Nitrososphaerales archaeon]
MRGVSVVLLVALTFLVISYPANLHYDTSPVQSLSVFSNSVLFAIIFYFWMGTILFFLILRQNDDLVFRAIPLIAFACVFLGLWVTKSSYGLTADEPAYFAGVRTIILSGRILPPVPNYAYTNFPGVLLVVSQFSEITGLSIISARTILVLVMDLTLVVAGYLFFRRLRLGQFASLAILAAIMGSRILATSAEYLQGGSLALAYFPLILVLLLVTRGSLARTASILILFVASVMAYLPSSAAILAVTLVLFGWRISRKTIGLHPAILTVFVLTIISWLIYQATPYPLGFAQSFLALLKSGLLNAFNSPVNSATTGLLPLPSWAFVIEVSWLIVIYLAGTIIAAYLVVFRKLHHPSAVFSVPAIVGLILMIVLLTLVFPTGSQYFRFLQFGAFFTTPMVFLGMTSPKKKQAKMLILVSMLLLALSFPTFLVDNKNISTQVIYSTDVSVYQFIGQLGPTGVVLYILPTDRVYTAFYVPGANVMSSSIAYDMTQSEGILSVRSLVDSFSSSSTATTSTPPLFVFSMRELYGYQILGISPSSQSWGQTLGTLYSTNVVFEDGTNTIFAH